MEKEAIGNTERAPAPHAPDGAPHAPAAAPHAPAAAPRVPAPAPHVTADADGAGHAPVPDTAPLLSARDHGDPWWVPGTVGPRADTEPGWAGFVREAVARAPREARIADRAYPDLTGFHLVVAPFAALAADRLAGAVPGDAARPGRASCPAGVLDGFRHDVARRLAVLAARTLVSELHEARTGGRLSGEGPRERFRDFLRLTAGRAGLSSLVTRYPVLARVLAQAAMNAADAFAEMLGRLAADRELLGSSAVLGDRGAGGSADYGPHTLTGVESGTGDSHRGGRSVMLLRFADGARLVYKPRPLAAHRHFEALVEWFNSHAKTSADSPADSSADSPAGTPALRTPRVLDRGAYGWAEFVTSAPCLSTAETTLFYRRLGALLALLHVLDGTDLHHENLIACGPHPVLVDVETLFHPPLTQAPPADPAARALHASVHRVGLLPQLLVGDSSALDMSAVGGGRAASSPLETASWAAAGTDTMRLVRASGRFTASANRPELDGTPADPFRFTDALCDGFRSAYTAVSESHGELLGPKGLLSRFADDEIRFVPRPTWTYATLLHESTHPDLMRDATERQQVFALLRTGALGTPALPGLEDEEIAELWQGDVPVFTTRPDSTRVHSGTGREVRELPGPTGLARVEAKIRALDTVDRQDQERIIRTAMVSTSTEPPHGAAAAGRPRTEATAPEPERLLSAARSVGDQLVSLAYHSGSRTNWIGLELLGERYWRLTPLAADLAGGWTGPALFLAQLASLTGAARYADAARAALAPVPGLLDTLHQHGEDLGLLGSGAFSGLGGIAYTLAEVGTLLDDDRVRDWAGPATRLAAAAAAAEEGLGVRGGAAGGLVSLLAVHRATGRAEAWRGAELCAERLLAAAPPASGGFAEGAAGTGWALLRFAGTGGGPRHRSAGLDALRGAARGAGPGGAWCEGAAGVALAVADSPDALADPELCAWLEERAGDVARSAPPGNDSLCHGELGVLELLGHAALPGLRPHWLRRTGTLLAAADRAQPHCGTPGHTPHPGLLTGLSGIGHGLLRAGFPDRIGPALLMRHSAGAERSPAPMTLSTNDQ
ncbi:type 2 lanthipeptide synthetase LanM family protein [Streptomyces sp. NBC_00059]|uniref:type 2 lanthipeptide synthetase LanM family protein n=1 Tax=Streptomyces sp. NBC_00059 TaxID=2975635 RepID=UPI0022510F47|nr:type 2 lanthipeptide synthetase LanM family protein [Streptomyces sp. NBC_00059]MCX5412485.1 type 2 lanthipeptide synthetase LanM family protein [Streptomyces sp. NBC_00059]